MSLTSFVAMPDVKAKLKAFRPPPPRKIGVPIKVAHRASKDHVTAIGVAFDYFLRFELKRRAQHLVNERDRWVAESAPRCLKLADLSWGDVAKIEEQIGKTLSHARDSWKAFIDNKNPSPAEMEIMANYAIRLAKLDPLFRAHVLSPDFNNVDSESVGELLDLLAIVPWDNFVHSKMLLNPTFPASSHVGGADGDLITGEMLVDFKTVSKGDHDTQTFDQLLGYYLLANHFPGDSDGLISFPKINRVAVYYARHGHLWSLDTSFGTEQGGFPELKEWFFSRAKQVCPGQDILHGQDQRGDGVIVPPPVIWSHLAKPAAKPKQKKPS